MITFLSENISAPKIKKRKTAQWIKQVAALYKKNIGEVSYLFCNDEKILEINLQYLQHDFYTDIITFDNSEGDLLSGDIFISVDTVLSNSQNYNTSFEDELNRVIIHGILHLIGLNDESDEDSKEMRLAEDSALKILKELE